MACIEIANYTSGTILGTFSTQDDCDQECGVCCRMECNYDASSISFNYLEWTTGYVGNQPSDCDACYGSYYGNISNSWVTSYINATVDGNGDPYPGFWKANYPATGCAALLVRHSASWASDYADRCGDTACEYAARSTALIYEAGERASTKYFVCTDAGWVDKTSAAINPYMSNIGDLFASSSTVPIDSGGQASEDAMCCYETYNGPSINYNVFEYDLATSYQTTYTCVYWDATGTSPAGNCSGEGDNGCCSLTSTNDWITCNCAPAPSGQVRGACVTVEYGQSNVCDKQINKPAAYGPNLPTTTGEAFDYVCADVPLDDCPPDNSQCPTTYFWRSGKINCTDHECEAQMNASDSSETP